MCLLFVFPGTTLNLLKFPIINPTCDRIFRREERLKEEATKTEDQLSSEEKKKTKKKKRKQKRKRKRKKKISLDPSSKDFSGVFS